MRILVLHKNKFDRMAYDVAIDHEAHDVVYAGTRDYVADIPAGLRCRTFTWDADSPVEDQLRWFLASEPPYDRILARHETLILPAAALRAEFGIPGMKPEQARNFRDKVAMKRTLQRAGVRVPRFVPAGAARPEAPWDGKTIVKPRDEAGSQGVLLFDSYRSAHDYVESRRREARDGAAFAGKYELEEYLDGPIYHVDGYLCRGEPVVVQVSRYVGVPLEFEAGQPIGSVQVPDPELEQWAVECIRALGGESLTFHLEAIMTPEGPAFMEVAARAGGGYIVNVTERKHGVHLHTVDMASDVAGALVARFAQRRTSPEWYAFFLYPGQHYAGSCCDVAVPSGMLDDPCVVSYQCRPPDRPIPRHHSYRPEDLPLSGVIAGNDPDDLDAWLRKLFDSVTVRPRGD